MDWREDGVLLSARRHGETSAIVEILTREHGRHAGVVRGGASRKMAATLQAGTQVSAEWRARLEEHLGTFRLEPIRARAAVLMDDRLALAALSAICDLMAFALPEREPHPRLFDRTVELLDGLDGTENWPVTYALWELRVLDDLGFGLDLASCAVNGDADDLAYVSPKTGRSVGREAATEWVDRMLPLPPFLLHRSDETQSAAEVQAALKTTGYFLEHWLAPALGDRHLPESRARFVSLLARHPRTST